MSRSAWMLACCSGLLLGSATPPVAAPRLAVDPSALAGGDGCPEDAGDACVLLGDGSGAVALAGLPRPIVGETFDDVAPVPLVPPVGAALPPASPLAPLKVVISLKQQRAFVFRAGALVASAPVSTGRPGHPTPVGTFRILEKAVTHHSNIYSNAPMPFMQRLTDYGIALHAGPLPGYPASHGCIRLPYGFARKLYNMTDSGTRVVITREPISMRAA